MKKVFYLIDSLQSGGAERSILDIASRITLFTPVVCYVYKNDFLRKEFEERGIKVISLNVDGTYNFRVAYNRLYSILKQERPDLVVATLLRSELLSRLACIRTNIPNIGTFVNDTYSTFELQSLSWIMKAKIGFFWVLNVISARWCYGFLSNSESIKKSNCKALFVDTSKVKVIYRGRRTDLFAFSEHKIEKQNLKFLAVGRLLYRKGFQELFYAFSKFSEKYPGATLSIAGEGSYQGALEKLIRDLNLSNRVTLLGNSSGIPQLMRSNDIFVFPSHYEGFSGALVEAMLSGIPIIASNIEMNKEAVEHGRTALLFDVMNSHSLFQSMEAIISDPDRSEVMAVEARRIAVNRFDIDIIVKQHEEYYKSVLEQRKLPPQ